MLFSWNSSGILFYKRTYYRGDTEPEYQGREDFAEKTGAGVYSQQILVDHHSVFPAVSVWTADEKQFHELLCKMDV